MNERIDSIIDQQAIDKELKFLSAGLDKLKADITSFGSVKINLEGASNTKQLATANVEFANSLNGVKKAQSELETITERVAQRIATQNGHSKELTEQILIEAKATREVAAAKAIEEKSRIANDAAVQKQAGSTRKLTLEQKYEKEIIESKDGS